MARQIEARGDEVIGHALGGEQHQLRTDHVSTDGWQPAARRRAAVKSVAIAAGVLLAFGLGGDDLLRLFGISLPALRVGGGILLLLLAIDMVSGPARSGAPEAHDPRASTRDISVFPMAMPLIAGPAPSACCSSSCC